MDNKIRKFGVFTSSETINLPPDQQKFSQMWEGLFTIATMLVGQWLVRKGTDATLANTQAGEIVKLAVTILASCVSLYQSRNVIIGAVKKVSVKA